VILSERFVITEHREPMACIDYVESRASAVFHAECHARAFIACWLFQRSVYEYAHLNLGNDNFLDRLQSGLQPDDYDELAGIIDLAHANILLKKIDLQPEDRARSLDHDASTLHRRRLSRPRLAAARERRRARVSPLPEPSPQVGAAAERGHADERRGISQPPLCADLKPERPGR
jgi:hypothetical protein